MGDIYSEVLEKAPFAAFDSPFVVLEYGRTPHASGFDSVRPRASPCGRVSPSDDASNSALLKGKRGIVNRLLLMGLV